MQSGLRQDTALRQMRLCAQHQGCQSPGGGDARRWWVQGHESVCGSRPPPGYLPRWGINENPHPIQCQSQVIGAASLPPT